MGDYILVAVLTAIAFIAMILMLAVKPKFASKITWTLLTIAGLGNLLIYSYGYAAVSSSIPLAIIRAVLSVCGTFVGGNDFSAISSAPLMQTAWMQVLFWALRWCSIYATASAAVAAVGVEVLKKLRLWLARRGRLNIIYGVNDDTMAFGKKLLAQKQGAVVYVDAVPDASVATAITRAGCVLRTDGLALNADPKFLRSIGWGKKKRDITLYALSKDSTANITYARRLRDSLENMDTLPENSRLVILGQEEIAVSSLQVTKDRYGYGFVSAVHEAQLAARLLTLRYSPCDTLHFDENAKATDDFSALIIGFGQVGQAVLKNLVMNGQFEGSTFHAAVFAPDCQAVDGRYQTQFGELSRHYEISLHPYDGRSKQLYDFLRENGGKLKYAVVCTGSEKLNREMAEDLTEYFRHVGLDVPLYQCSRKGVVAYDADGTVKATHALYQPALLCHDELDRMAMLVNHRYQSSGKTPTENWMDCDYFSRQSCRASADFVGAMLRAAGKTKDKVMNGDWALTDAQFDNLSRTEHHRWCAFHYCMGFSPMTDGEFDARATEFKRQKEENGSATIRIGKNMAGRTHACLIPWEELDQLSAKENAITGKNTDYKQMDTDNVLVIPELLKSME